jgi:5S rRNA maturation endonuclease (ribonuclease M5)
MANVEKIYQLGKFYELYISGYDVKKIKPIDSEEYRAFKNYRGSPIRLIDSKKSQLLLPNYPIFFDFFTENPYFWMIPCEIPSSNSEKSRILGFYLRSYFNKTSKRKYFEFSASEKFPVLYGLSDFHDFREGDPIILVEGIKDALLLKKYYKYTISLLTNNVSTKVLYFLRNMTNKIIVSFDKDNQGLKGSKRSILSFKRVGINALDMTFTHNIKDWGNFFSLKIPEDQKDFYIANTISRTIRKIK